MNKKLICFIASSCAAIILVGYAGAIEFYFNESAGEQSVTASGYTSKVNLGFAPPAKANYTIIAAAEVNHSSAGAGQHIGASLMIDGIVTHEILYRPKDITDWFPFSAVKRIELNTSQHNISILWNATSTGFIRNARIFVMQVDAEYNESEGESTTSSTTPVEKLRLNFTPSSAGSYLIIASANIQNSANARAAVANLYIDNAGYMECEFEQRDSRNRYGCAAIKNITLNASQTVLNLTFNVNNAADTATIKNAHLLAIRLDAFNRSYYNESEPETTPAAANNWYNKTVNSYSSTPGRHLILGSIEQQAGTASSNRITFYNGTTKAQNISIEATATSDWAASLFITVANLTEAFQSDRIEHSATGGTLSNLGVKRGRLLSILMENSTPIMSSISASSSPIKGGDVLTIAGSGIDDPNSQTLNLYCSESSAAPTAANTICTGGTTIDTSRPYGLTCTYSTTANDATHTPYCRVFDGDFYSYVTNTTFITDSTPPTSSVINVAGDADVTYYDKINDGWTNITANGEANMACRWGTSDIVYASMTNECTISGSQTTCSPVTTTQGLDAYNFYVSCRDSLGNSQNTTQNLDIVSLVTDWTAPTTSDNSSAEIWSPPYTVEITENDNLAYGAANIQTLFCKDAIGSCTPSSGIDSGGTVTFTSSERGINFLRYNSSDPAGNTQAIQNKTININRLPVLTSAADNVATIKGGSEAVITTFSSDSDSGQSLKLFVCNSTSVSAAGCAGTTYCSNTTDSPNASCSFNSETDDATHTWHAFLYDSLNESASTASSGAYVTDSTAPTITIINPANQTYSENSVSAQLSINEAANWAGYSLDNAANVSMVNSTQTFWSATMSGLSNGGHIIRFYANDSYENMGTATRIFSVDTTLTDTSPPTITVWSPVNGTYYSASILANITLGESGSSAAYSLNGTANVSMGNLSLAAWNATINPPEGSHNIRFYANDSSANKNSGNSSLVYFFFDVTTPQNVLKNNTPLAPNDTVDITCHSQWTDNIELDYGYLEHNETGTAINSSLVSLAGNNWLNYTISSVNTTPGIVQCKAYVFDKAGLANTANWIINIADITAPAIENVTYLPNTTNDLDPGVMVNVTAFVSDNVSISSVIIQYRLNTSNVWTEALMSPVTPAMYSGNFTPTAGNWSFRVYVNDTSNNTNASTVTNITVGLDYAWLNVTNIPDTKAIVQTEQREINLGNITINNTGDFDLNFTVTSDTGWVLFNRTNTSLSLAVNSTQNKTTFNVTANTTGFAVGTYAYSISINAYAMNTTLVSSQNINGTIVIQNVAGPFFAVTITNYDATVTQGDADIILTATLSNLGTIEATGAWLNWTIPSGWTNTSGSVNNFIGFLGVGSKVTSNVTILIGSTASLGAQTITASAGSNESASGSDSKSVTVSASSPTSSASSTSSGSGGGLAGSTPATVTPEQKALLLQTSETLELVRGLNDTFVIKVTNPFRNSVIKNITLDVKGFLARYISTAPDKIFEIPYNETWLFKITITAPAYLTKGTHPLNFTITGRLVEGAAERTIIEQRFVTLSVHEISRMEANATLEQAINNYQEMLTAGFPTATVKKLLEQAKNIFEKNDYEKVNEITGMITFVRNTAFKTKSSIESLSDNIKNAEKEGLRVDGAKNLLNLALAAFEREDYASAEQRIRDAQLVYAIETIGKINYIKLLMDYWWAVAIFISAVYTIGIVVYRRVIVVLIARKLEDLAVEEASIAGSMKEAQKMAYEEKTMSATDYHKAVYGYESRLSEIKKERAGLRAKRVGILKAPKEMDNLKNEDEEILGLMKNLQREYFERRSMSKPTYDKRMRTYRLRKAEIEEALAVLETKPGKDAAKAVRKEKTVEKEIPKIRFGELFDKIKKVFEKKAGRVEKSYEGIRQLPMGMKLEVKRGPEETVLEMKVQPNALDRIGKKFIGKPGTWLRKKITGLEQVVMEEVHSMRVESIKQKLYNRKHYYEYYIHKPDMSDKIISRIKRLAARLRLKVS